MIRRGRSSGANKNRPLRQAASVIDNRVAENTVSRCCSVIHSSNDVGIGLVNVSFTAVAGISCPVIGAAVRRLCENISMR